MSLAACAGQTSRAPPRRCRSSLSPGSAYSANHFSSPYHLSDPQTYFAGQVLPQLQHARRWRQDLAGGRPHAPVRLRRGSELSAAVRPWRCGRDYLGPARGRFSSRAAVSGVRACRERILGLHATLDGSTDRELQPKAAGVPYGRVLGARQVFPFQQHKLRVRPRVDRAKLQAERSCCEGRKHAAQGDGGARGGS